MPVGLQVFRADGLFNWTQIHSFVVLWVVVCSHMQIYRVQPLVVAGHIEITLFNLLYLLFPPILDGNGISSPLLEISGN